MVLYYRTRSEPILKAMASIVSNFEFIKLNLRPKETTNKLDLPHHLVMPSYHWLHNLQFLSEF